MIAVNGGFDVLECRSDAFASITLHSNGPSFVFDDDVVFEEAGCVLRDWIERPASRSPSHTVNRMRVAHGYDVGVGLVHSGVQHEACSVECMAALANLTFVIGQYQIRYSDLCEMNGHRICPIEFRKLRIAYSKMPSKTVIQTMQSECSARTNQSLLAVPAFLFFRCK